MSCENCNVKFADYFNPNNATWCTNCGNYGIYASAKRALVAEQIPPNQAMLCFDIGCHGNGSDKIEGYRFHGLHGRVIPLACGIHLANTKLKVIAFGGDGGTLSEGINHLVQAVRNDYDITFILHNNSNYALTLGQASATTVQNTKMNAAPDGVVAEALHVLDFVFSLKPTFVARGFSGDVNQLSSIIQKAINHKGFSFVEVLQDCPTFNKATPHEWYLERVYDVSQVAEYDLHSLEQAKSVSSDLQNRIATGVIYQSAQSTDFYAKLASRQGRTSQLVDEVKNVLVKL